jgi:hypothetical protein
MTACALIFGSLFLIAGGNALAAPPSAAGELRSKYASQLDASDYPAAPAPTSPLTFALDFSKVHTHRYFYEQMLENHVTDAGNGNDKGSSFTSSSFGDLMVYAEPDHTAQIRFENVHVQSTATFDGKPQRTGQKLPATWIGNMNQSGGFDEAVPGQSPLMALLFPVPSKPLAVGESVETSVELDLPVLGTTYAAKGVRRITCTGYVTVARRVCAKLEQTIELSAVDDATNHRVAAAGRSVSFFAPSEGRFIRSTAVMTLRMTDPAPPVVAGKGAKTPKTSLPSKNGVSADNFVKIVLGE